MPFFTPAAEDDAARLPLGRPPEPPIDPSTVAGAAFRQDNSVVSAISAIRNSGRFTPDPDHNPLDVIKGTPYEQTHLDSFVGSRSEAETRSIMGRIDQEENDKRIIAGAGAAGVVASMIAGWTDPVWMLMGPAGPEARAAGFLRGASRSAMEVAAVGTAQETLLQSTQQARPLSESLINVGSMTLLAALIGGGAGMLAREGRLPEVAARLDQDRAEITAHAAPEPPPERITGAAVRVGDEIFAASTHAIAADNARYLRGVDISKLDLADIDGFATSTGRYVSREEAAQIAERADQVRAEHKGGQRLETSTLEYGWFSQDGREPAATAAQPAGAAATDTRTLVEDRGDGHFFVKGGPQNEDVLSLRVGKDAVQVGMVTVGKADRGQGIAREMYERAIEFANERGLPLRSDMSVSAAADRVYESLKRRGYSITEAENTTRTKAGATNATAGYVYEVRPGVSAQPSPSATGAAGAAVTDTRTLKPVSAFGLEKLATDPVHRTLNRPFVSARRAMADLSEIATEVEENVRGGTTTLGGGPSLETLGRITTHQTNVAIGDELTKQWTDLRFGGEKAPWFAKLRDQIGMGGKPPELPTFERFKELVSDAMMNGDRHDIPQVAAAAQFIRPTLEHWSKRAEASIEGFKPAEQIEGEGYFPHAWNKEKIKANRPGFVDNLTELYAADQRNKATIQGRLSLYAGALESHEATIKKLSDRLEHKAAALESDEELKAEVTRVNKFAFQRATQLRESEFRNEGGVRVPVPGKNIEKARGGAVFETKVRERGNTLGDRASAHAAEVEELERKLSLEHSRAAEVREKIETEIGSWEGKSSAEAKAALKAREKYELERIAKAAEKGEAPPSGRLKSADSAVDKAVKHIIESDRDLSIDELRAKAHETTDRILGSPDGRLPYDEFAGSPDFGPRPPGAPARGSLAERALNVSNAFARDWIERDIEQVVRTYMHTFMPDVMLAERFGDVEMSEAFRKINDEHAALSDATKGMKEAAKLEKQKDGAIEDLAATRDRFRGLYNIPQTASAKRLGRISAAVRNANVPLSLGMAAVSSLPDAAGAMFRWGMMSALSDGWVPFVKSVMSNRELAKEELRQFKVMGIAIDTITAQRHHEFAGITETYKPSSPLERTLQWGADKFNLVNLLGPWTDMVKSISSTVAATGLLRAAEASVKGTATAKQVRALGAANITPAVAERIAEQYRVSGTLIDGVLLPNTQAWTDAAARTAFEGALAREANIAVVTPGLDKPLFFNDPVLAMMAQFKSFTAAAHTRILIANLQRRDADVLSGLIGSLGVGMLSYKINSIMGGQPTSDNPGDWIKEAMSRGNIFGWFEEGNAMAAKMTRGRADVYRALGSGKELSRYAGRSALDQVLGPTAGKIERLTQVTGAAAARDWSASDTHALRQLMVFQNLFWLRGVFNQLEAGANNTFGIPAKAETKH
jgi:predicted GNAT family acetyltransferase